MRCTASAICRLIPSDSCWMRPSWLKVSTCKALRMWWFALAHSPEAMNVGGATVILMPQQLVDESAADQQHERAVNPTAHGGIPRIHQPAGEQCAPSSHDEGSQDGPHDLEARIGLRQASGVR